MCFRCDLCGEPQPAHARPAMIPLSYRVVVYPPRPKAHPPIDARRRDRRKRADPVFDSIARKRWRLDRGGDGFEPVKVARACGSCAEMPS